MAKGTYANKAAQSVAEFVEDKPAEGKTVRRKSSGRPRKGEVKKISLSISVDVYEGVELASYFFKGNVTEYINTLIRRDLRINLEKYREFKAMMEDFSAEMDKGV